MKHGAITFSFLLLAGVAAGTAFTGCSDDETTPGPAAVADTGVAAEAAAPDTRPALDTAEVAPYTCAQPLPAGYKCEDPEPKAGKTVCTDEAIDAMIAGCFVDGSSATACQAAQKKYAACNTCMISDWLIEFRWLDSASCIKKVAPTDTCATTIACNIDCMLSVCSPDECSDEDGSGSKASTTEFTDCLGNATAKGTSTKPRGVCYDLATKDLSACSTKDSLAVCFPSFNDSDQLKWFYRGACRDGADWSNVTTDKPTATDAGPETAPVDTGVTDTGVTDTGVLPDLGVGETI